MRFITFSVPIFLAFSTSIYAAAMPPDHAVLGQTQHAHKNHTGATHAAMNHTHSKLDRECAKLRALTSLTDLVNNATKLNELETEMHLDASQIAELKAKASNATAELTKLQSNTTLVADCAVVDAGMKLEMQCREIKKLTALENLVNNATALNELETMRHLNATQIAILKEQAANATTKLADMQKNTTLVQSCGSLAKAQINGNATASVAAAAAKATSGATSRLDGGNTGYAAVVMMLGSVLAALL